MPTYSNLGNGIVNSMVRETKPEMGNGSTGTTEVQGSASSGSRKFKGWDRSEAKVRVGWKM